MRQLIAVFALLAGIGTVAQEIPWLLTSGELAVPGSQPLQIPRLGLGTWHIHDNDNNVTEIIARALEMGYRHIDCAYSYGNQKQIGKGIAFGLERTGLLRTDIWVTSKLWNNR
jgi:diketogulonate reductase-like aldo/keto reductase